MSNVLLQIFQCEVKYVKDYDKIINQVPYSKRVFKSKKLNFSQSYIKSY